MTFALRCFEFESDADVGGGRAIIGKGDLQAGCVLSELEILIATEELGAVDLCWVQLTVGPERLDNGEAVGPALNEGVDGRAFGCEANVRRGEVGFLSFVGVKLFAV